MTSIGNKIKIFAKMTSYHIKIALRNIAQLKSHTVISLTGLIVGLACVFVISAWTIQELKYDKFHKQPESIYMVTTEIKDNNENFNIFPETPPPLAQELKDKIPAIEKSFHFIYLYGGRTFKTDNNNFKETGIAADSKLLHVLNFPLLQGSAKYLDEPNSILITQSFAEKLFPNEIPLGKSVVYNKDKILTIKGVLKNIPENSSLKFDFIVPYQIESENPDMWWQLSDATFIKTTRGADIEDVKQISDNVWREKITDEQYSINFIPISNLRYGANFNFFNAEHGNYQKLYAFIGIAILILILVSLNYINLISAHSFKRRGEVGIRKVNGASSNTVLKYFLTESVITSIIASCFAILFSIFLVYFFKRVLIINISWNYLLTSYIVGVMGSIIIIGLISGLYPAIMTSSFKPFKIKNDRIITFKSQNKLRNAFILGQFILSIFFTIVCLVILNQLKYMDNFDVGFSKKNIVQVDMPSGSNQNFQSLGNDLLKYPEIQQVSFAGSSPVNLSPLFTTENWKWEGLQEGTPTSIYRLYVDNNYLNVFKIPILKGEFFKSSDSEKDKIVINEKLATLLGFDDPIGKIMSRGKNKYEVIGVVKNFHFQHLSNDIHPLLFMYSSSKKEVFIKLNNNFKKGINIINKQYSQLYDTPVRFSLVTDVFKNLYSSERKLSYAIIAFTIITVILSCIGLVGLVTFNIELKTKEIGVRKVCGAKIKEVILMLNKRIVFWFILGVFISCILSWLLMNKWLENFAFRITLNLWTFIFGSLIILGITALTVSLQTWKAAIANPVDTLKYE